jgi:hypothetical protein
MNLTNSLSMKVIALTGRAGSGKDTAALGIRMLTGSLDPTWMMSIEGCPITGPNRHVVDLKEFFNINWPDESTDDRNQWKIWKFAYPVYQIAAILTGHDPDRAEYLMTPSFKESYWEVGLSGLKMSGGEILQKAGTEAGRMVFGDTIWLHIMNQALNAFKRDGYKGVIVTDCRFPNEAEFLRNYWQAIVIGLSGRDGGVSNNHPSESELSGITTDFHTQNDGTYSDLMFKLNSICDSLKISNHQYKWK